MCHVYSRWEGYGIKIQIRNLKTGMGVERIILQIPKGFFQKAF